MVFTRWGAAVHGFTNLTKCTLILGLVGAVRNAKVSAIPWCISRYDLDEDQD